MTCMYLETGGRRGNSACFNYINADPLQGDFSSRYWTEVLLFTCIQGLGREGACYTTPTQSLQEDFCSRYWTEALLLNVFRDWGEKGHAN